MNLLERYLRQIERYLPFKERKETTKELRSLIMDQVDEQVENGIDEEKAIHDIITDMGNPRNVAHNYVDAHPIISKEMEPILMLVLKIVVISTPLAVLFAQSISYVFGTSDFTMMDFFLNLAYSIPSAMYSLVVAIGFVFIFFFFIGKFISPKYEVKEADFIPELLPEIPKKNFKISLLESVVTILVTVIALYLFNFQQGLIAIYYDGTREPLLNSNFDKILPFMNISWFVSISLHIYYAFKRRKNIPSKTVEFGLGIIGGVIAILLGSGDIFNDVILEGYNLNFIPNLFKIAMIIIGVASIIGSIVEYIKMFINIDKLDELEKMKKSS